jgi:hypothetical protein
LFLLGKFQKVYDLFLAPTEGKILRFLALIGRKAGNIVTDYYCLFAPKILFD